MLTYNHTDLIRFWKKVKKSSQCWLWTSAHNVYGYGVFRLGQKVVMAHRLSYVIANGDLDDNLSLDHLCRVHNCVNPAHLEPVTRGENVLRGVGFAAQNSRKTPCPKGHPLVPENLYRSSAKGGRKCRECVLQRQHEARPSVAHLPKRKAKNSRSILDRM